MRRKKGHSVYSFHAMISNEATTIIWASIGVSLCFFAYCACDDAVLNSRSSTISGHVISTTTPMLAKAIFTNHSRDVFTSDEISYNQTSRSFNSKRHKRIFIRSGNELWDGIIDDCLYKPSFSCFQKNVYTYLDKTLKFDDVNITDNIQLKKINIDPDLMAQLEKNPNDYEDNEVTGEQTREFKSESPIEEVTDAMYGKWRSFMMTHNLKMKLPEMVFDGATFQVTPRGFDGDGVLVKLEMIPKALEEPQPRILFKKISKKLNKIKKFFKGKLILSLLAIVLVIKLIKIKLFWVLPLIVGVTAAKKMLLKFVLFLFPALSHLFKLCSYYHKEYHETKYHHHRHQINHLHTVVPPWYKEFLDHPHKPELIHSLPPKGHPAEYIHNIPAPHQHQPSTWEYSGPGLGSEYISDIHRNIHVNPNSKSEAFRPNRQDEETLNSWGLDGQSSYRQPEGTIQAYPPAPTIHSSISPYPAVPTFENTIGRAPTSEDALAAKSSIFSTYEPSSQIKYSPEKYLIAEKIQNALRQPLVNSQTIIESDPFYGLIVARIDSILNQYTVVSENCKEWLVCNMYKNPDQFSPHSNFLSAELSRDSSELQKPTTLNAAVLTFYKYVKAARDGQDQKNCLALNPKCTL